MSMLTIQLFAKLPTGVRNLDHGYTNKSLFNESKIFTQNANSYRQKLKTKEVANALISSSLLSSSSTDAIQQYNLLAKSYFALTHSGFYKHTDCFDCKLTGENSITSRLNKNFYRYKHVCTSLTLLSGKIDNFSFYEIESDTSRNLFSSNNFLSNLIIEISKDSSFVLDTIKTARFFFRDKCFLVCRITKSNESTKVLSYSITDTNLYRKVNRRQNFIVKAYIDSLSYDLTNQESEQKKSIDNFISDSLINKQPIVSGEITTQYVLGNNRFQNQTLPSSYLRNQGNLNINAGILPIKLFWTISNELSGTSKLLNYYGVSIDFETLRNNLNQPPAIQKTKLNNKPLPPNFQERQLLRINEINRLGFLKDSLTRLLTNLEYKERIKLDSIALIGVDTGNLSYSQQIQKQRINQYDERSKLLQNLTQLKQKLELEERQDKFKKFMRSDYDINETQLQSHGLSNKHKFLINNLRKFDFGAINPFYSDLTLSQLNLLGINTELGVKYLYFAFTAGNENNFGLLKDVRNNELTVYAGRVGVGSPDKLLFSLNAVRATRSNQFVLERGVLNVSDNIVTSASINYNIKNSHHIQAEYAKSIVNVSPENQARFNNLFNEQNTSSTAINLTSTGKISKNGNYHLELKYTEPFYIALASPNLRQDHFRFLGRIRQHFFKSRVNLTVGYQFDQDNLGLTKPATSYQHRISMNSRIKLSPKTQLTLSFIPTHTIIDHKELGSYYNTFNGYSMVSVNHTRKFRNFQNLFNITYQGNYLRNKIKDTSFNNTLHYLHLLNALFFRKYNLSINTGLTGYTSSSLADSTFGFGCTLQLKKQLVKHQFEYGLGSRYQYDNGIDERLSINVEGTCTFKYQIYASLRVEQFFVINAFNSPLPKYPYQISILVTKRF